MDRVEIRPGARELPKDSLEKFRQKEPSAEIHPTEPNRPDVVRRPGIISSPDQRYEVQASIAQKNATRTNEQLARLHQEGDASRQATSASRDALHKHENFVRIPADPAARENLRQQLDAKINAPDRQTAPHDLRATRADYERYLAAEGSPAHRAAKRE